MVYKWLFLLLLVVVLSFTGKQDYEDARAHECLQKSKDYDPVADRCVTLKELQ